jgi:peptide/nickel transport system permease protein
MHWFWKRTGQAVGTVFVAISITFVMLREMPGGPADFIRTKCSQQPELCQGVDLNNLLEIYAGIQPDKPLYLQYIDYMGAVLTGDLGRSITEQEPVINILAGAMPWTVFVMSISLFLSFFLGVSFGAYMAYREGSMFDISLTSVFIGLSSIPYYIVAIILLFVLAYEFQFFPTGGRQPPGVEPGLTYAFIAGVFYHATLPILSNVVRFGGRAITMRGNSIRVLGEDYMRVARLRGLPEKRIALRYVARNAILPMYTRLMISIGYVLGGSVILESIFNYTGVGYYLFQAVQSRDYRLMMGAFLFITIAVVLGVYVADLTYGKLDPRASGGGSGESF